MRCHRLRQRVANASKMDYGIRRELNWLADLLARNRSVGTACLIS